MKTCIIIPARLASARLKKKMLANIHGLPMVIHTMKRGLDANVGPVYIATPDDEIESTVIDYCGSPLKVIDGDTGTDRVYNAVKQYDLDFDYC